MLEGDGGDGKRKLMVWIGGVVCKGEGVGFSEREEREGMSMMYERREDEGEDRVVGGFN